MFRHTTTNQASRPAGPFNSDSRLSRRLSALALCLACFVAALGAPALAFGAAQEGRRPERTRDNDARRQPADGEETVLLKPLSPDDPRAKIEAELLSAPPVSDPVSAAAETMDGEQARRVREYDVRAGVEVNRTAGLAVPEFVRQMNEGGHVSLAGSGGATLAPDFSGAGGAGGAQAETIFGADNRVKVTNCYAFPWRATVSLYITWPSGVTQQSSGVLVHAKYVLTAGQNVYNHAQGGWARYIRAVPAACYSYAPYGQAVATNLRSFAGWVVGASADHNMGLITLSSSVGLSTGWFGMKAYPGVVGLHANIAGYSPVPSWGLYWHAGPITAATPFRLFYTIDTAAGQGGSGIYHVEPGPGYYVFGVHTTGGVASNSGTRLTGAKLFDLAAWIATGF
jgi:glutamyl endopeptidase